MSNLTYLNDASVLHNLKQRYYAKLIYVRLFHPRRDSPLLFFVASYLHFLFFFFFLVSSFLPSFAFRKWKHLLLEHRKRWIKHLDVPPRFSSELFLFFIFFLENFTPNYDSDETACQKLKTSVTGISTD